VLSVANLPATNKQPLGNQPLLHILSPSPAVLNVGKNSSDVSNHNKRQYVKRVSYGVGHTEKS